MASKLYIGGLSYSTTSDGLREFFSQSGNVLSATVITDRFSGQSRGFGLVEMSTAEEAQNAISQLNRRALDDRGDLESAGADRWGRGWSPGRWWSWSRRRRWPRGRLCPPSVEARQVV